MSTTRVTLYYNVYVTCEVWGTEHSPGAGTRINSKYDTDCCIYVMRIYVLGFAVVYLSLIPRKGITRIPHTVLCGVVSLSYEFIVT